MGSLPWRLIEAMSRLTSAWRRSTWHRERGGVVTLAVARSGDLDRVLVVDRRQTTFGRARWVFVAYTGPVCIVTKPNGNAVDVQ